MKYNLKSFLATGFLVGISVFYGPHLLHSIYGIKIEIPHINKLLLPG